MLGLALLFSFKFWFILIFLCSTGYYIYQHHIKKNITWFTDFIKMMSSWTKKDRIESDARSAKINEVPEFKFTWSVSESEETPEEFRDDQKALRISKGQRACHKAIEEIYGAQFRQNVRPNFLKNPETGHNLEIDIYNDDLKIGIEYQGAQHYKWPNFTNQTEAQFREQLRRDDYKKRVCAQMGIHLIIVPYTVKLGNIKNYISERLPSTSKTESYVKESEYLQPEVPQELAQESAQESVHYTSNIDQLPYEASTETDINDML